jgi:hypothetical protein
VNSWYSLGILTSFVCSPAWIARSVDTPPMVHSVSSCHTIDCFSPCVNVDAMIGCDQIILGLIDEMITGMNRGSMVALLQLNFGSNVANQGYPSRTSSCPMSVMRHRISLWIPLVTTFKSR